MVQGAWYVSRCGIIEKSSDCPFLDSDIIHLNVAGTSIIVLDTSEAVTELLERRSSIYSGRCEPLTYHV